jgi:hypothetical protein
MILRIAKCTHAFFWPVDVSQFDAHCKVGLQHTHSSGSGVGEDDVGRNNDDWS